MKQQITERDLIPLVDFINDFYDGDLSLLNNSLSNIIYMMHYLEPGNFQREEVFSNIFALEKIKTCLHEGYKNKNYEYLR